MRSLHQALRPLRAVRSEHTLHWLLDHPPTGLFEDFLSAKRLTHDSRQVGPNDVFIALPGNTQHGARFIANIADKASIILISREDATRYAKYLDPLRRTASSNKDPTSNTPWNKVITLTRLQEKIADIAAHFYGEPSRTLPVTAITGTNGKTSLTWILKTLTTRIGQSAGVLGTISIHFARPGEADEIILETSTNTTPHALDVQHALAVMREEGIDRVFLEASSHGLAEDRLAGIHIQSAILTNLSQDHLDYHPSMEDYFKSKLRILEYLQKSDHPQKRFLCSLRTLRTPKVSQQLIETLAHYGEEDFDRAYVMPETDFLADVHGVGKWLRSGLLSTKTTTTPPSHKHNSQNLHPENLHPENFTTYTLRPPSIPSHSTQNIQLQSHFTLYERDLRQAEPSSVVAPLSAELDSQQEQTVFTAQIQSQPPPPQSLQSLQSPPPQQRQLLHTVTDLIGEMNGENLALALLELRALVQDSQNQTHKDRKDRKDHKDLKKPSSPPQASHLKPQKTSSPPQDFLADFPVNLQGLAVPGRMERVSVPGIFVVIDYAHTPAALEEALLALRPYARSPKKHGEHSEHAEAALYVLFGCGGDRDRSKRPQMGAIAYKLSDGLFITSDNTRTEDPKAIINDILKGIPAVDVEGFPAIDVKNIQAANDEGFPAIDVKNTPAVDGKSFPPLNEKTKEKILHSSPEKTSSAKSPLSKPCHVIVSRREALRRAVTTLKANSILLVAGKGHEGYEDVSGHKRPFDEREIIKDAARRRLRDESE